MNCFHWLQARLRLSDEVEKEDVNEAMRLTEMSKDSLVTHDQNTRSVDTDVMPFGRPFVSPIVASKKSDAYTVIETINTRYKVIPRQMEVDKIRAH